MPPLVSAKVPPRVRVPEEITGPPVKVMPVVEPSALTLVTVPVPGAEADSVLPVIDRLEPRLISPMLVPVASDPSRRLIAPANWILS